MKKILASFVLCVFLFPQVSLAGHSNRVERSDLDDDIVKSIPAPVLFGVDLNALVPDFGEPRDGGTRLHEGQDMLVPRGTPIVSPTEAIVLSVGVGPSAGKFVYTANPGGETFRYMHLDEIADIEPGDELDIGDFIGTVGDTGNAPDGAYHLHFEMRDEDNKALDPFPRLDDTFTVKEKMSFLRDILRDVQDEDEYAEFLVTEFPSEFLVAEEKNYRLPNEIEDAIESSGLLDSRDAIADIKNALVPVPQLLTSDLRNGDSGPMVQLLQLYLMFHSQGQARNSLFNASATGYYGAITEAAVLEYQAEKNILETGVYDAQTRKEMLQ